MTTNNYTIEKELGDLESGRLDPEQFPHREHVRLGFEMLRRYSFAEAALRFGNGLRRLTEKVGKPEVYNETITIAFLALIGERLARNAQSDWAEFIAANSELADKKILERWYDAGELKSEIARKTFVLPVAR